jgi:hypothetical protein
VPAGALTAAAVPHAQDPKDGGSGLVVSGATAIPQFGKIHHVDV